MTPSGWGEDAQGRDAGHDEMQARCYRDWLKRIEKGFTLGGSKFLADKVYVEHPFTDAGRLIGFADIAVRFVADGDRPEWFWWYEEIKPRIYSVGAVIRQCEATEVNALRAIKSSRRANGYHRREPDFVVYAIVYEDDPKAALLKELYPTTIPISREATP